MEYNYYHLMRKYSHSNKAKAAADYHLLTIRSKETLQIFDERVFKAIKALNRLPVWALRRMKTRCYLHQTEKSVAMENAEPETILCWPLDFI